MGGGREEGLAKEGGAVGVPSAQAPRGAGGGRGRALCATSRSCCRLFIVCVTARATFPGKVWETFDLGISMQTTGTKSFLGSKLALGLWTKVYVSRGDSV